MFDKAGEAAKPANASRMKIRGAFIDTQMQYEDREVTFANGDICKLRIMKPGPADFNWWQARLINEGGDEGFKFPRDCYADIIIRSVFDPETNEPVFDESFRSYLNRSAEPQIIQLATEWLREISKLKPTRALKNSENPEEEN